MKDKTSRLLYIGKAANLKKRVKSHFNKNSEIFLSRFIDKVYDIDWIKTDNEKQALLLENQLIRKYQPRYNIQWRDDKSYFWVFFTPDEWPKVEVTHQNKFKVQSLKFKVDAIGPFVNGRELKKVLRALRRIIPFRTCKNPYEKPCLQWHLGLCAAHNPSSKFSIRAVGSTSQSGKVQSLKLKKNYLNLINTLSQFLRLYAGEPIRIEAYDISNIQGKYATGSLIVFEGDKPKKSDYRKFRIKTVAGANDVAMIKEVIGRRLKHSEWPHPDLILIDGGIAQLNAAILKIKNLKFKIPAVALAKQKEEIYTEYSTKPLALNRLPQPLGLIFQAIRNEAHRFAIFYYRYLHSRAV